MLKFNFLKTTSRFALLCLCLSTLGQLSAAYAQSESVEELKRKSAEMVKRQAYTEALPILEKLAIAAPDDAQTSSISGSL